MLFFEWDTSKARKNIKIHGVSFDEASTAFKDILSLTIYDPLHSDEEDRFILIGNSHKNRLLVIVHTERGDKIRIISARKTTKNERKQYEENAERSRHA
ncbi:MAG TPA: BrnT family toxin [Candidatus Brocadiaceae bacterium]|nr:BrnT family toxin [Candidatus Brocadiaceae bacterium]